MARVKDSERLVDQGWGIHIPSNDELRIQDAARELGKRGRKARGAGKLPLFKENEDTVSSEAVAGIAAKPRLGAISSLTISPLTQVEIKKKRGKNMDGKQALYQLRLPQTKEMTMETLASSETADEGRLMADEERLARDRAIRQHLFKLSAQKSAQQQQQQQQHKGLTAFLASRRWHSADAKAVSAFLSSRATGSVLKPVHVHTITHAHAHHASAHGVQEHRELVRQSIENNLDPSKRSSLTGHGFKVQLPKLNFAPKYDLPGDFSNGLPDPIVAAGRGGASSAESAHAGKNDGGACHNAYDCFGSIFQGHHLTKGLSGDSVYPAKVHITDPKAFIKGQGLGCHTLGKCLGSFFEGNGAVKVKASNKALSNPLKSKVNLDGWSTAQFTKGLENGMNIFPPDKKNEMLQIDGAPVVELVQLDDQPLAASFFGDETVQQQQMGDSPAHSCCGDDMVEPIATLGYGVWKFGQDVQNARVWRPVRAGLEGVDPFKSVEPVIQTGDFGLEPAPVPVDPTGTGRFE